MDVIMTGRQIPVGDKIVRQRNSSQVYKRPSSDATKVSSVLSVRPSGPKICLKFNQTHSHLSLITQTLILALGRRFGLCRISCILTRVRNCCYEFGEFCVYRLIPPHLRKPKWRNMWTKFTQLITGNGKLNFDTKSTSPAPLGPWLCSCARWMVLGF